MSSLRCWCDRGTGQQANSDRGSEPARSNRNGEAGRIKALDGAREDAIIKNAVADLDQLACDDLVYTHAEGLVEGKAGFVDHTVNGEVAFIPGTAR